MSEENFVNELDGKFLGAMSLNPWVAHSSSSRLQMLGSHLGAALSVTGSTVRRCQTGYEREYGKNTFSIKMPVDATIIRVFSRYQESYGLGGIKENPQTVILYEEYETKRIGCLELPHFHCIHKDFGFRYVRRNVSLHKDARVKAGTIIADSPSVTENGDYKYGTELNVAFMSVPAVIEDGVVASETACRKLTTKAFGKRECKWGKKTYPLNLYGNDVEYKAFPDIGDRVRDDGLLFVLRQHDEILAPVKMTPEALRTVDYIYDKRIYAEPNAKVVDVRVYCDQYGKMNTPIGMESQADKYVESSSRFYSELLSEYERLYKQRKAVGGELVITPHLHRLLVEAKADSGKSGDQRVTRTYKRAPLDDYHVEITFEYDMVPNVGFKLTGCHGDKGVICKVVPDADMPIDANGNRAELIMDGESTIKRTNVGRFYEQAINAYSREITEKIRMDFGLDPKEPSPTSITDAITKSTIVKETYEYLLGYYRDTSPAMYEVMINPETKINPTKHVESVLREGIYLWLPTNNEKSSPAIIRSLRGKYPLTFGPVTYRGQSGNMTTTVNNVLIGSLYIMLLDKTGANWAAVSSAKLLHFGTPAKLTNNDKYGSPGRLQTTRTWGEAEGRLGAAVMGEEAMSELLDRANNPSVHKQIVRSIYNSDNPLDIKSAVDRRLYPRGLSRTVTFVKHLLSCAGARFERKQ